MTHHKIAFLSVLSLLTLGTFLTTAMGFEPTHLVTYGVDAQTIEGDDDFLQVIFIRIPETMKDPLYVRIFDADCGGTLDARYSRKWDTHTRFRLFGGKGAYPGQGLRQPTPGKTDLNAGVLIADQTFGEDPFRDNQWHTFAKKVLPDQGEKNGKFRYFKLVVQGKDGDDGNRFSVAVSLSPRRNQSPDGLGIFSYAPTIHLPRKEVFAELRFHVPENEKEIIAHNFDLSQAAIGLDTAFRSNIPMTSSGQDEWTRSVVSLDKGETGRMAAIRFAGGEEVPNDGSFYVTDKQGNLLQIWLPAYLQPTNTRPKPHIDIEALADCRSVLFDGSRTVDADGDALTFLWHFGDNETGKGERITHQYALPGRYDASMIVEDSSGQISNSVLKRFPVIINHPPLANAGPDLTAAPGQDLWFDASGSADPDGKVVRYVWDFKDGHKAQGEKVRHAYARADFYTVTLRVEDDSKSPCNFAVDETEVWINARPVLDIGKDRIASVREALHFSGVNSSDSDGELIAYEWDMGDGTKKSGTAVTHAYQTPGTYQVQLVITDDSGAKNRSAGDTLNVFVNDPPVADIGRYARAAVGEPVLFDGSKSFDRDGELIEYSWDFGDGTVSAFETRHSKFELIPHGYEKPGEYQVRLRVKDDSGSSSDTDEDEVIVIINDPPVANAGPDQWVTQTTVQFDGTGSLDPDGEIIEYSWDFGDASTGTGISPVHVYQDPGTYTVRVTVTDDSGTSSRRTSDEMTVIVNHLPVADAGPDRVAAPGQVLSFDASGSSDPDGEISAFQWDFGDGFESEKREVRKGKREKVSHAYDRPGTYTVLLTAYDDSGHEAGVDFDEARVVINAPPVAHAHVSEPSKMSDISKTRVAAPGNKILFHGTRSHDPDGEIVSYQWAFPNAVCDAQGKESFKCRMPDAKLPKDHATEDPHPSSLIPHPSFQCQFSEPGVYTAVLAVTDDHRVGNSAAWDEVLVRINHRPVANAGKNIHTNGHTVLLDGSGSSDADGDPLIHVWDFGDNAPHGRGEKVFHTYAKGGTYPVILTVDDGTGLNNARSTASVRVRIDEAPVADAGEHITVCAGNITIFDGVGSVDPEGGVMRYHWNFDDGTTADEVNPTKVYMHGGVYSVSLTVTDDSGLHGNADTDQITVKVVESPIADAGPDQTACAGEIIQFDGAGSRDLDGLVNSFEWDFGDGTTGGGPTPIHVYSKAGTYRVRLVITGDRMADCDNTDDDEMILLIHASPVAEFTYPVIAEMGRPVPFDASQNVEHVTHTEKPAAAESKPAVSIIKWEWDFGDGTTGEGEHVAHTFDKAGDYVVTLTVTSDSETTCNKTAASKRLTINAPPVAVAGDDRVTGVNQEVVFDGSASTDSDGVLSSFEWDFGDGRTGTGVRTRHQYENPGQYDVRLRVTDNTDIGNNNDTDALVVTVNDAPTPVISKTETLQSEPGFQDVGTGFAACAGKEVVLTSRNSHDSDGEIVSHAWNFGDGSPMESGADVRHTWHFPGNYVLTLEADDGRGVSNSRAQISARVVVNEPPIADAGSDRVVSAGEAVTFDGSGSMDREGPLLSFQWDFGDGARAEGEKASHLFKTPGKYPVRLMVTDDSGSTCALAEDLVNIRVNAPPVPDAGGDREGYVGGAHDAILFDATKSHDPDGDPLTFYWDFGDGENARGPKVRHQFKKPGKYAVRLRVDDGTGVSSGIQWDEITVQARPHQ